MKVTDFETIDLDQTTMSRFELVFKVRNISRHIKMNNDITQSLINKVLELEDLIDVIEYIVFTFKGNIKIKYNGKLYE
jgi:hypothetical protein